MILLRFVVHVECAYKSTKYLIWNMFSIATRNVKMEKRCILKESINPIIDLVGMPCISFSSA